MLQKLVFVKYNQTLKENRKNDEYIDPVLMDDPEINVGSYWLLGDEVCVRDGDAVYDDDDLGGRDVEEASGVAEPLFNTRSQVALQKVVSVASTAPTPSKSKGKSKRKEKRKQGARGKQGEKVSKGKGKKAVVVDEYDPEFINDWGDEEKEDEEEDIEEKEEDIEEKENDGGSDDEDFHDY